MQRQLLISGLISNWELSGPLHKVVQRRCGLTEGSGGRLPSSEEAVVNHDALELLVQACETRTERYV